MTYLPNSCSCTDLSGDAAFRSRPDVWKPASPGVEVRVGSSESSPSRPRELTPRSQLSRRKPCSSKAPREHVHRSHNSGLCMLCFARGGPPCFFHLHQADHLSGNDARPEGSKCLETNAILLDPDFGVGEETVRAITTESSVRRAKPARGDMQGKANRCHLTSYQITDSEGYSVGRVDFHGLDNVAKALCRPDQGRSNI